MRVSLVFPAWTTVFGDMKKVAKGASTFPPLNLLYLAAIAEKHGHTAQVIDGEAGPKEDISKIPGIVYRKNGNVIYTGNNTIITVR